MPVVVRENATCRDLYEFRFLPSSGRATRHFRINWKKETSWFRTLGKIMQFNQTPISIDNARSFRT